MATFKPGQRVHDSWWPWRVGRISRVLKTVLYVTWGDGESQRYDRAHQQFLRLSLGTSRVPATPPRNQAPHAAAHDVAARCDDAAAVARDLLAAQARITELEATIARARNEAADMQRDGWHPERRRAGAAIESALATPGKAMGEL